MRHLPRSRRRWSVEEELGQEKVRRKGAKVEEGGNQRRAYLETSVASTGVHEERGGIAEQEALVTSLEGTGEEGRTQYRS